MFRSVCCVCQRTRHNVIFQQVATYLPPPLPSIVQERIKKQKFPDCSLSENVDNFVDEKARSKFRRRQFARFGAASGVNPASLFPSEEEVAAEAEAEKRWWPTLQRMQMRLKMKAGRREKRKREREEKIAANMAKMPEWIEKFEETQRDLAEKAAAAALKKQAEIEMAQEKIGFDADPKSPIIQQYFAGLKEKQKKERKLQKRKERALASLKT